VSRRKSDPLEARTKRAPAISPEDRENQLTSLAYDLAEKQLREGTASSQVITEFLKRGSTRDKLERAKLEAEGQLLETKRILMEAQKENEGLYAQAISAFRAYSGEAPPQEEFEYDDLEE
jgi:hypothetical protein